MKKGKATPKSKAEPKASINLMAQLDAPESRQQLLNNMFPTVFDLAAQSVTQLLAVDSTMHITQARPLLEQAKALTGSNARLFREQRLSTGVRTAYTSEPGIKGLIPGPTYTGMFNPDWAAHCPPGAIEATTSPIAYLTDLYREAENVEKLATGQHIPLAARRPDLAGLMLDHTTLNQIEPTLVLVNEILETSIRTHLNDLSQDNKLVDDAMLQARYPHTLPYERYQQQINHVLGRKQQSLGDAVRCIDSQYPYFKEVGGRSAHSDNALQLDTGFGPAQQKLLLEAPYFPANDTPSGSLSFFKTNYGKDNYTELLDTQTFCLQTGLSTDELDSLLSTGPYAPTQSPNAPPTTGLIDGALFGSVYINGGQKPAVAIQTETNGTAVSHKLINISFDKFDRINRMIRLARWLGLPFDQVDRLLIASFTAQQPSETPTFTAATLQITTDTLRSLGLFQRLRASHNVTADDFAALLNGLATEGRGKELSQFDRVFNRQALFPHPFKLDDSQFAITPVSPVDIQKVDQLCAALGMSYEAYRFTAKLIKKSLDGVKPEGFKPAEEPTGPPTLNWSNVVISAFYRLVRLPRYLGLSTIEALALLELLDKSGSKLVSKLAGRTSVTLSSGATSDTLSALHALVDFSTWLNDNQWPVSMICRTLLPGQSRSIASEVENSVIQQIYQGLDATLLTENSFAEAAIPAPPIQKPTRKKAQAVDTLAVFDWFDVLKAFIDDGKSNAALKGLVLHHGADESTFEKGLSEAITDILKAYPADQIPELRDKLLTIILRSRDAQAALILEGLALYLAVPTHLATNLMQWAGGNRYQVLKDVIQYSTATADAPVSHVFLPLLTTLVNLAAVTTHLKLSPALIALLAEKPEWFGLPNADLTLRCVYILTQYTHILSLSEQSEDALLNYFQLINNAWPTAQPGDKPLYRDSGANKLATFLQWGAREVLAVGFHLHPVPAPAAETKKTKAKRTVAVDPAPIPGVIFTLAELDVLVRIAQMCRLIGLDAKAMLDLGNLSFTSTVDTYRRAAEQALSCLVEGLANKPSGEVGQSTTTVITVIDDYLVANMATDNPAALTLTLKDYMDVVMPDTTITWRTNLGRLLGMEASDEERGGEATDPGYPGNTGELQLITNGDGQCKVLLKSGKIMGMTRITAHYGLDSEALAPAITIDCDEKGLSILDAKITSKEARSNNEGAITFSVKLQDAYGNLAINREVEWTTTVGEFQGLNPRTNNQGISSVTLRSSPYGTGEVVAKYLHNDLAEGELPPEKIFTPITFTRHPYFQYVRFDDFVMQYMEEGISCKLVELNGDPIANQPITWKTTAGTLTASSTTDSNGVAIATFKYDKNEEMKITVSTAAIEGIVIPEKSITAHVNLPPTIKNYNSSGTSMIMGTEDLTFNVWLESEGKPARYVDMTWTVIKGTTTEGDPVLKESDSTGKSSFNYGGFKVGTYKIRAQIDNVPDGFHEFNVECVAPEVITSGPTDLQYPLGSGLVEFFVELKVKDFVIPDIGIVWKIGNTVQGTTRTNQDPTADAETSTVKVTVPLSKFPLGPSTVTATIEDTDAVLQEFKVVGTTKIIEALPDTNPIVYIAGSGNLTFSIELENGPELDPEVDIEWYVGARKVTGSPTTDGKNSFIHSEFSDSAITAVTAKLQNATPAVEKTFNVKVVNRGFSSNSPTYVEFPLPSSAVTVPWVIIKTGTAVEKDVIVTWTLQDGTTKGVPTDANGKSAFTEQLPVLGTKKITASAVGISAPITFIVSGYTPTLGATSPLNVTFKDGDPTPPIFIEVRGGTNKTIGYPVTWNIGGTIVTRPTDSNGRSQLIDYDFNPGITTVKAFISTATSPAATLTINKLSSLSRFDIAITGDYQDPDLKTHLARGSNYTLTVKVLDFNGNPMAGVNYKLTTLMSEHTRLRNEIDISDLDDTKTSKIAGDIYTIKLKFLHALTTDDWLERKLRLTLQASTHSFLKNDFDYSLGYLLIPTECNMAGDGKRTQLLFELAGGNYLTHLSSEIAMLKVNYSAPSQGQNFSGRFLNIIGKHVVFSNESVTAIIPKDAPIEVERLRENKTGLYVIPKTKLKFKPDINSLGDDE